MPQKSRNRKSSLAALCAILGVALIVASGTVAFAGDDEDDELWDVKMVRKFMRGFGLRNGQEAGIEYKERPPLVLPPGSDLPAPAAAHAPGVNNPAWPIDPDEKRRAEDRKAKRERRETRNLDRLDTSVGGADGNPLKPSELEAGRGQSTTQPYDPNKSPEMTPSQLGFANSMWSGMLGLGRTFTGEKEVETRQFVREPSRSALTDPPSGYRTPSPAQPYGINSKADRPKASAIDRQTDSIVGSK